MPRKRLPKNAPNDFLDDEKLTDNAEPRLSLNRPVSPPTHSSSSPPRLSPKRGAKWNAKSRGKAKAFAGVAKRPQLTHFLCLPLVNETSREQLEGSLEKFKQHVCGTEGTADTEVPLKAIRPLGTLHLTLGVMSLDADALTRAQDLLSTLNLPELLSHTSASIPQDALPENKRPAEQQPLNVTITSLTPMHAPHKTSILYASPHDPTHRLYPFANELRTRFMDAGFLVQDDRELKLHATIVNTIYAKPGGRSGHGRFRGRRPSSERNSGVKESSGTARDTAVEEEKAPAKSELEAKQLDEEQPTAQLDRSLGHGPDAKSWRNIDARALIERYRNFVWAEDVRVGKVVICKMGAKKILDERGEVMGEEYEVVVEKSI